MFLVYPLLRTVTSAVTVRVDPANEVMSGGVPSGKKNGTSVRNFTEESRLPVRFQTPLPLPTNGSEASMVLPRLIVARLKNGVGTGAGSSGSRGSLATEAQRDLIGIYRYVATHDSVKAVGCLLDELEALCAKLSSLPQRGHAPPELERVAVTAYREVHFKPYRVIYEVVGSEVFVHCILDGRRDMQSLLERRLLR